MIAPPPSPRLRLLVLKGIGLGAVGALAAHLLLSAGSRPSGPQDGFSIRTPSVNAGSAPGAGDPRMYQAEDEQVSTLLDAPLGQDAVPPPGASSSAHPPSPSFRPAPRRWPVSGGAGGWTPPPTSPPAYGGPPSRGGLSAFERGPQLAGSFGAGSGSSGAQWAPATVKTALPAPGGAESAARAPSRAVNSFASPEGGSKGGTISPATTGPSGFGAAASGTPDWKTIRSKMIAGDALTPQEQKAVADRTNQDEQHFSDVAQAAQNQDNGGQSGSAGGGLWPTPPSAGQAVAGNAQWPLGGKNDITQGFGCTDFSAEPADSSCPSGHFHEAIDIAVAEGTDIHAFEGGTVTEVESGCSDGYLVCTGPCGGYGNHVILTHPNGYMTYYGHMKAVAVSKGQTVTAGQVIGQEGTTGCSTGPHTHFVVRKGPGKSGLVDPRTVLP